MNAVKSLYYFHGWNSSIPKDISSSAKLTALESFCREHDIKLNLINVDYKQPEATIRKIAKEIMFFYKPGDEVIFAGTSLGGWFARIVQLRLALPEPGPISGASATWLLRGFLREPGPIALAFNPAFNPGENLQDRIGMNIGYDSPEPYEWLSEHCDELSRLQKTVPYTTTTVPMYVFVDEGDMRIPWRVSEEYYQRFAKFYSFPDGNHGFEHMKEALEKYINTR